MEPAWRLRAARECAVHQFSRLERREDSGFAIADHSAECFDGELHGGHHANASRRSVTGGVCSPNPTALRGRSAGIPAKNEAATQTRRTFQAKSLVRTLLPANQLRKCAHRLSEAGLSFFAAPARVLGDRGSARHRVVSAAAAGVPPPGPETDRLLLGRDFSSGAIPHSFDSRCSRRVQGGEMGRAGRRGKEAAPADRGAAHEMRRIPRD
jgi:hypothetical protein